MFSLEPIPALKAIQHTSCMEVSASSSSSSSSPQLELITSSSRRKVVRIHAVRVDRWEVLREVSLPQDPVSLAVDGPCVCVATGDRYHLLCDLRAGGSMELFPHGRSRQQGALVVPVGGGEFLLNAPGSLAMFVTSTGTCRRPPMPWAQDALAAAVCLPYVVALRPGGLSVYSLLDRALKADGGSGRGPGPGGVLAFTDRQITGLSLVPLEEQIRALAGRQRPGEALSLLDGVRGHLQPHAYEELRKDISYLAGVDRFNQQAFAEAKELFITGDVDPREIISLYPDMGPCLGDEGFVPRRRETTGQKVTDLRRLQREDAAAYRRYLAFLADYLAVVRAAAAAGRGGVPAEAVDCALLRVYAEQGGGGGGVEEEGESLRSLVASPNACSLHRCVAVLEQYNRYFVLGMLYQSHGNHTEAIKTWVKIADGHTEDSSCPDVYGHIVSTLTAQDTDTVWMFAEWALQKNQEVGVQIFTKHHQDDPNTFRAEEIITLLKNYPHASLLYLEFLINEQRSETESHHTRLALAYVLQILEDEALAEAGRDQEEAAGPALDLRVLRCAGRSRATGLHAERAILLGRSGDHDQALRVLVHEARDPGAARDYCHRAASRGEAAGLRETLLLALLAAYLSSDDLAGEAVEELLLGEDSLRFPAGRAALELLPGSWSVGRVGRFLVGSLRGTLHQRRMAAVQRGLAQAEFLRHKALWVRMRRQLLAVQRPLHTESTQASQTMVRVRRGQACRACQTELTGSFARTARGDLLHTHCMKTQNHPDPEGAVKQNRPLPGLLSTGRPGLRSARDSARCDWPRGQGRVR
ncbi:Transforming growth factor-beta receptor-associated protein 1 [Merluccius polli]|uniref:Transforming growth factor-beta receptor-associated protein 1 n=1 Tax=Merluccius polli TaxID=89951 RepID=A0AA47NYG0_MERPO|nr:Transforming growth factor-beta receptor-associated protein 1 [Merluccius polli]